MEKEQEYKIALMHVIKFIREGDPWKPLNAGFANQIAEMCERVIDGETTEQAINNSKH